MSNSSSSLNNIYFKTYLASPQKSKLDMKVPIIFVGSQITMAALALIIIAPFSTVPNNSADTENTSTTEQRDSSISNEESLESSVSTTSQETHANANSSLIPESAVNYNGNYYQLYSDVSDSWEEAERYCEAIGGHLAVINNNDENNYLYQYMLECGFQSAYFGIVDNEGNNSWQWIDGSTVEFTNWAEGEPSSSGEPYGMFYFKFTDGKWNDGQWRDNTTAFICEWEGELKTDSDVHAAVFLDELPIIGSDRYTGNEGDSFVFPIGKHEYSRGNTCTDGETYEHGIEGWIARWNGANEKSWAYATFDLNREYYSLHGECKLINSYNTNNFNTTLEFWNKDILLHSYVLTPDSIPFSIDLDVSNCDDLKIYFYDNDAVSGGTSFGLINMELSNDTVVAQDCNDHTQSGNIINGGHGVYHNGTYYLSGESLRKIEQDNSETILLNKTVYYLNAHKDYLYFTESDDDCIYRIKTDGTGLELLCNNPSHELTLYNDMLYFCTDMGNNNFSICKMNLDGTNQTELFSHNEWYMNVANDYVYFTDYDDGRKIKRMNLDGSNIITLIDKECFDLCVIGNSAYYTTDAKMRCLHKYSLIDNSDSIIRDAYTRYTNYDNNGLYYVDQVGNLCRCNMNGAEQNVILESNSASYLTVLPNMVLYCDSNNHYALEAVQ